MTHSHVASSRPLFSLHALQDFLGLLTTLFLGATVSSEDAKGPHLLSSPTSSHTHLSMPTACPISPCSPASPPVLPVLLGLATLTLTLLLMSAQFSLPSFHQWKMGPSQGLSQNYPGILIKIFMIWCEFPGRKTKAFMIFMDFSY